MAGVGLRYEGVTAGYGRTVVLRDVDLVVPAGRTVALLGANGAGKTTLLKTAAGLVRNSGGSVWLGDRRIDREPANARSRAGLCLIAGGSGIFRGLTVRENVAMFCNGIDPDEALDRAVDAFPILGQRLKQPAGQLSGGQQQMLALARGLVIDAPVILADELSLGLAPVVVDEIFEVVERFRTDGRALLLVEQFVHRVLEVADYVYILHRGQVAFAGEPSQCQDGWVFEQYLGVVG